MFNIALPPFSNLKLDTVIFLDPVGSLVSTLWVVVVGCCCWSHFSKLVNFECVGMLKCVGVLECVRVLEC